VPVQIGDEKGEVATTPLFFAARGIPVTAADSMTPKRLIVHDNFGFEHTLNYFVFEHSNTSKLATPHHL
jgi:hypothetical protein